MSDATDDLDWDCDTFDYYDYDFDVWEGAKGKEFKISKMLDAHLYNALNIKFKMLAQDGTDPSLAKTLELMLEALKRLHRRG